jgi:DNA-binding NtrC family response regulator
MRNCILAVDDDTGVLGAVSEALEPENELRTAHSGEGAIRMLESFRPDAAIVDYRLPDMAGDVLIRRLRDNCPAMPVIALSAVADVGGVVRMMREGSVDYLAKPFDAAELQSVVGRAIGGGTTIPDPPCEPLLGVSAAMAVFRERLVAATRQGRHILIVAEAGFDLVAIARHISRLAGPRTPLLVLQGGEPLALPADFPPAPRGVVLCPLADDCLQSAVQVLEMARWRGLTGGGRIQVVIDAPLAVAKSDAARPQPTPVATLLAAHPGIVSLRMPPLRERSEDIPRALRYFIDRHARLAGRRIRSISLEAMDVLLSYPWPGNIREMDVVVAEMVRRGQGAEIDDAAAARLDAGAFAESALRSSGFAGESLPDGLQRLDRMLGAGLAAGVA